MSSPCQHEINIRPGYFSNALTLKGLLAATGYTLAVPEHVGKEIKRRRAHKGWTQKKLAEAVDVTFETISRIERGEQIPHKSTLRSIMDALAEESSQRPRPETRSGREGRHGGEGSQARVEDRLSELLAYIGTLEGKRKSEFIRAVVALLAALDQPPGQSGQAAGWDGR